MPGLRVPTIPERPFDAYFRELVRESVVRSAEAEYDYHLRAGHGLRARRAARLLARAQALQRVQPTTHGLPRFGRSVLASARLGWIGGVAVLAWAVVVFGVRSWATGVADLAVVALTFAWFVVAWGSDERRPAS